jgi:hypothetical protein
MKTNILAENMLRFGPKNLSESDRRRLQNLLTEGTFSSTDPNYKQAEKYFAGEWAKQTSSPQFATAAFMYKADPVTDWQTRNSYTINLYKVFNAVSLIQPFFTPIWVSGISWENETLAQPPGFTRWLSTTIESPSANTRLDAYKTVKDIASTINTDWNEFLPEIATTYITANKSKMTDSISKIKATKSFAELGPMLTGTAKTVYDLIAA